MSFLDNLKKVRIRKRFILLMLLFPVALVLVGIVVILGYGALTFSPREVTVSNVTPYSATISWVTKSKSKGTVMVLESPTKLPVIADTTKANKHYDDRDWLAAELKAAQEMMEKSNSASASYQDILSKIFLPNLKSYHVHHVTLRNLNPETDYYLMVGNGSYYKKVELGEGNRLATLPEVDKIYTPEPAYGMVQMWGTEEPITDGTLYLQVVDQKTGSRSSIISTPLSENGSWYLDLNSALNDSGDPFLASVTQNSEIDHFITLETGEHGRFTRYIPFGSHAPAETIILGQFDQQKNADYELRYEGNTTMSEEGLLSWLMSSTHAADCTETGNVKPCSTCAPQYGCDRGITFGPNGEQWGPGYMEYCAKGHCEQTTIDVDPNCECGCLLNGQRDDSKWHCPSGLDCKNNRCVAQTTTPTPEPSPSPTPTRTQYECANSPWNPTSTANDGDGSITPWVLNTTDDNVFCPESDTCPCVCNVDDVNKCADAGGRCNCSEKQDQTPVGEVVYCTDNSQCILKERQYQCSDQVVSVNGSARRVCNFSVEVPNPTTQPKKCTNDDDCIKGNKKYYCNDRYDFPDGTNQKVCNFSQEYVCSDHNDCNRDGNLYLCAMTNNPRLGSTFKHCDFSIVFKESGTPENSARAEEVTRIPITQCSLSRCSYDILNPLKYVNTYCVSDCDNNCDQETEKCVPSQCQFLAEQAVDVFTGGTISITRSYYSCKPTDQQANLFYNVCRNNSPFGFISSLITSANAQTEQTEALTVRYVPETGSYITDESGIYYFIYEEMLYSVLIDSTETEYIIYIDQNDNGVYDPEIDIQVASDPIELSFQKVSDVSTYSISRGFNFVSFDFIPEMFEPTSAGVLEYLNTQYNDAFYSIAKYNPTSQGWDILGSRDGNVYGNALFQIAPGVGYVLRSSRDIEIAIPGFKVETAVPVAFSKGWNLVALHGTTFPYTAQTFLETLRSTEIEADNVSKWDSSRGRYDGLQITPDGNGVDQVYGYDYPLYTQQAYFVKVLQGEGRWTPE